MMSNNDDVIDKTQLVAVIFVNGMKDVLFKEALEHAYVGRGYFCAHGSCHGKKGKKVKKGIDCVVRS